MLAVSCISMVSYHTGWWLVLASILVQRFLFTASLCKLAVYWFILFATYSKLLFLNRKDSFKLSSNLRIKLGGVWLGWWGLPSLIGSVLVPKIYRTNWDWVGPIYHCDLKRPNPCVPQRATRQVDRIACSLSMGPWCPLWEKPSLRST